MMNSENSDTTQYHCLNDTVITHSEWCLHTLAVKWGLKNKQLQMLQMWGISSQMLKWKMNDSETESQWVRFKSNSKMKTEIFILFFNSCQTLIQKHIKMSAEATVLINTTLKMVLKKYEHISDQINSDKEFIKVRWFDFFIKVWQYWVCVISDLNSSVLSDRVWVTVLLINDWKASKRLLLFMYSSVNCTCCQQSSVICSSLSQQS